MPRSNRRADPARAHSHAALRALVATAAIAWVPAAPARAGAPEGDATWAVMPDTAFSLAFDREGSGTSWLPERGPVPGAFGRLVRLQGALRWNLFLAWLDEGGPRGTDRLAGPGFASMDVGRDLGAWRLAARATVTPERWTIALPGAPLLFRSGAVEDGTARPDHAPPRPLVPELALLARLELAPGLCLEAYGALAGEPALGPAAASHRLSATFEPAEPIADDILGPVPGSRGTLSAGVLGRRAKLEASLFGARPPGTDPTTLGAPRIDSGSARLSVSLGRALVAQASGGRLGESGVAGATGGARRASASLSWADRAGTRGGAAVTLAAGRDDGGGIARRAALLEAAFQADRGTVVFGRAEWAERTAAELRVDALAPDRRLGVGRVSLGGSVPVARAGRAIFAAGLRGALALAPAALDPSYGKSPLAAVALFLQLRPALSRGGPWGGHRGEGWGDP